MDYNLHPQKGFLDNIDLSADEEKRGRLLPPFLRRWFRAHGQIP